MVKVTDCGCCDCDDKALKEQIKDRALSSINKVYTFDDRTYWPDGTGMVTLPLPTQDQLNKIEDVADLEDRVTKNTTDIKANAELIAGHRTELDSLETTLRTAYQAIAQKGSASGYAGLDNNAKVPLAQLYVGTSANQVPLIGKQLLVDEVLIVDADGQTIRSKPLGQVLSFRGIYPSKSALPTDAQNGDYAVVSDGTAQDDTGYYVYGYNSSSKAYEWVWTILFDANNYQLIRNMVTVIDDNSDDSHYPSAKAVKDYHDASAEIIMEEAKEGYQAVALEDSVLSLTKGNGSVDSVTLPAGDDWEELDLDDPSSWGLKTGDILQMWIHLTFSVSNHTSVIWSTVAPVGMSISGTTAGLDANTVIKTVAIGGSSLDPQSNITIVDCVSRDYKRYIAMINLIGCTLQTSNTNPLSLTVRGVAFNGAGVTTTDNIRLTGSDPTYKDIFYKLKVQRK